MQEKKLPATPARTVGRPRRLTVEAIVEAACELGVANLDMSMVAERLNTGVATLYGYVRGREHLLELVAERLAHNSRLRDRGQSWQEIIREHAALTYALFQSQPQLITNLMVNLSDTASIKYWHDICNMLERRGITVDHALSLYVETNQAVIGAAVCLMRRKTIEAKLAETGESAKVPTVLGDYQPTLERIISAYEAEFAGLGAGEVS